MERSAGIEPAASCYAHAIYHLIYDEPLDPHCLKKLEGRKLINDSCLWQPLSVAAPEEANRSNAYLTAPLGEKGSNLR